MYCYVVIFPLLCVSLAEYTGLEDLPGDYYQNDKIQRNHYLRYNFPPSYIELCMYYDLRPGSGNKPADIPWLENNVQEFVVLLNTVYRPVNIIFGLKKLTFWDKPPFDRPLGRAGGKDLTTFYTYFRKEQANPNNTHCDIGGFISDFASPTAWGQKGPGRVFYVHMRDRVAGRWLNGLVNCAAHEIGHNLGSSHASPPYCNNRCIMNPSVANRVSNKTNLFANSTLDYINATVHRRKGIFDRIYETLKPICGDRIQESDEECDCGTWYQCRNDFCDPMTCTLANGSQCAQGECCDVTTGQFLPPGTRCLRVDRSISADMLCDLPEFCDGKSGDCPVNRYKSDGTKCANHSACVGGRCRHGAPISGEIVCAGRGVLDNAGDCYCFPNYAPPECINKGSGGSLTSNNPDKYHHFHLYMAIGMFFVCLPILTALLTLTCPKVRRNPKREKGQQGWASPRKRGFWYHVAVRVESRRFKKRHGWSANKGSSKPVLKFADRSIAENDASKRSDRSSSLDLPVKSPPFFSADRSDRSKNLSDMSEKSIRQSEVSQKSIKLATKVAMFERSAQKSEMSEKSTKFAPKVGTEKSTKQSLKSTKLTPKAAMSEKLIKPLPVSQKSAKMAPKPVVPKNLADRSGSSLTKVSEKPKISAKAPKEVAEVPKGSVKSLAARFGS